MRQINVYRYEELPTEEAKEKARDWWVSCELQDPAWRTEHFTSMDEALKMVSEYGEGNIEFQEILKRSEEGKLTGYCADAILGVLMIKLKRMPHPEEIEEKYNKEWEDEINARIEDKEYIEDAIMANLYEFLEDGSKL